MANLSNINGKFVVEQTTGYVGIGTTDPNFLIEAAGTNSEIALNSTSGSIYRVRSTSGDAFIITKNGVGDRLIIDGAGATTFSSSIDAGGRIKVSGGSTDQYYFEGARNGVGVTYRLYDNANNIYHDSWSSQVIRLNQNGGSGGNLIISGGNVGIGTSSPSATLDVLGSSALFMTRTSSGLATYIENDGGYAAQYMYQLGAGARIALHTNGNSYFNGGNVGIGTTSPNDKLEVSGGNVRIYSTNNANHLILKNNATATSGLFEERIKFLGWNDNENASIIAKGNAYFGSPVNILAFSVSASEKMSINHSGNVAISGNGIQIDRPDVAGGKPYVFWKSGGTTQASIYGASSGAGLRIFLSGGIADFDNNIKASGVYLGGTTAANRLDYYKTDTWAPQIYYQNATDQANATNSTQTGIYTKIGNVCTVQFRLIWTQASGTPAVDNIGIKNLPFGGNTTQAYAEVPCSLIGYTGGPSPRGNLTLTLPGANQTLAIFNDTNNVGNMGNAIGSGTKEIRFSFTYLTN